MDIQDKAFKEWFAQYDNNIEYASEKISWDAWQAAKAQADQKIKLLLCDEHLKKCESPTGVFNSQYPDEEPCLICLAKETKAQAVPEWKDYTVESPRIDGPYQIFIMNQQLVAKWESPWGFSSTEDGDALNQELITHWSVLGNDPAIEPKEPQITELKVEWASDCFKCGHHEAIIYSTAAEASTKGWFHDGDEVKCTGCGNTGEMDARDEDSDICWNEDEAND